MSDFKTVYTICGMCTVRCPAQAFVKDGEVSFVRGNPHAGGIKGSLCARGAAGVALTMDDERPQTPLIREGERGEGKWRSVSWDEALDYVADKIKELQAKHGKETVLFSDRGGPFRDHYRAFLRGIGTPNYCNHDSACARNVQHGAMSVYGFGRKTVSYDLKNAKHVVLQTRNIFEAINVKEVNDLLDAMDNGCKLTVIDVRANIPASKADNVFIIRPGSDYGFNLAVLHVMLRDGLYDKEFADKWIQDLPALEEFVRPYTPEWAEKETGAPAAAIEDFVKQIWEAAPSVIWHPGWMTARYSDSFYVSRTAYLISALLGCVGAKGGLPLVSKPGDVGAKGLKSFMNLYPKPEAKRVDGVGWEQGMTHLDPGPGLVNLAYKAIETGKPYPITAYIAHRHDPLMAFPDKRDVLESWKNLELLVSVTFSWSDTAWNADVVLPLSPYLERDSIIATKNGLSPHFFKRNQAMKPRYDTKAEWEIYSELAKRFGLDEMVFDTIEDLWNFQLQETGVTLEDFEATGTAKLTDSAVYKEVNEKTFKTPSGKVEVISAALEKSGLESLPAYKAPAHPPAGRYRITFGRCGLHTQGHTVNNPLLFERMPENILWMHPEAAQKLGIESGEYVEVGNNGYTGRIRAYITQFIHPEAVFMVHGFGHDLPAESRAFGKGAADNMLMPKGIDNYDKAGGAIAMQEHFIEVRKTAA
ncbi:molybdopterin-dependent oxidoreductase [Oceanidesulfovibrio marinus]|uniref:Thiosulfate reductase n=1 Tax=Oceanidesulfovibrio marinus TaxID=370038 RepID=A0ABX6NEI8_9BACT|nr:molybdopterin-dependent oxidoreductase [Oceanidesulfovibrio marinus]QJT08574.1 thiosulfate reductase [Oceanidesulfovibrio marinus]URN52541.1 thiosulfate reductase [Oceanidesulfovibrio marinus]